MKINCSNPLCRQRVEVDDSMAGQPIQCPVCHASLQIPLSRDIRLNCGDPKCGQHIVVDVSEAGRFIKCPACGKPLQIPGAPPKPLLDRRPCQTPLKRQTRFATKWLFVLRFVRSRWGRLACGWGLGAGIVAILIVAFNSFSEIGLPSNLNEMSDEIYLHGIGQFRNTPVQLHGKSLLFLKYIGDDVEVYQLKLATSQVGQLTTIRNISSDMGFVWIGWSPSAQRFAYCGKGGKHNQSLFVCDGTTGEEFKSFDLPDSVKAESGIWLSDDSIILASEDESLLISNLQTNDLLGKNGSPGVLPLAAPAATGGPVCKVSGHSIAYVHEGNILTFDLRTEAAVPLIQLTNRVLSGLCFSPDTRRYLFAAARISDPSNRGIYQYDSESSELTLLQDHATDAQWIQEGSGVAFISTREGRHALNVKTKDGSFANVLSTSESDLQSFAVDDDSENIYGITCDDRGSTSIVRYGVDSRKFASVYRIQNGYNFCKVAFPTEASTTNRSGEPVDYYYIPPPDLDPAKRYPVLMDMTSSSRHDHGRDAEFLANCGVFYVSPNKLGITKWGITPKPENTLAVYEALIRNPNIDKRRIYITGESITTGMACEMISSYPELWRGFIAMEPAAYPAAQLESDTFSALICMGEWDQYNGLAGTFGRAEKFVSQASANGISARIRYQRYTPHAFQPEQYKDAYETVAKFIITGY